MSRAPILHTTLLLLVLASGAAAQSNRGSLTGQVLDRNRSVVSGATVSLKRGKDSSQRSMTTDATGSFRFDDLTSGEYSLEVMSTGFSSTSQELALAAGERRNIEMILEPASLAAVVVVSATRLTDNLEPVERTPGSVEIIDSATLENSRVLTSSEALRKVAGLNVRDEEGFGLRPNIGIRGLNPTRSTKVLLLEDGIPLTYAPYGDNASYYHPPIDRFESVEVLKGSGQILYGPVTVGGVINFITPTPPVKPSGSLTLIGGNRDYFNGHINYGGTWKSTGLLVDYLRKQGEGARENIRSGLNDFNFKSITTFGSQHALTLRANYYSEDSNITYSGLREDEYSVNPRQNPFRNDFFYIDRFGGSVTHAWVFNSDVLLTTNLYGSVFQRHWWRQSSNSTERPNRRNALSGGDPDCTGMADLNTTCGNQGRLRKYYTWGVEPRLRVNHSLFGVRSEADFGFRAHFETQERRQENGDLPTSRSGLLVENNQRRNQAYSAFVQNRFLMGKWTITPGIRVEHVNYQRTNRLAGGGLGVTGRTNLTQMIPGLGISYNPTQKITIFAGAHRGFAPPRTEDIINNTTGGSVDLDPELSWNYEVGMRSRLRPGVNFDATFFRMDYENQVVPASLAGGVGSALTNGGETLHQGAEFAGRVDSGAILRSRHNVYVRAAYTYLPVADFKGARFSSVSGFGNVQISGNRLPYAPEHLLNFNLGYSHPMGLDTFLEAVHVSSQFGDDLNTIAPSPDGQRGLIPDYTIWNATGNYYVESWHTTFFLTVKNLFDSTYIVDRSRGILPGSPRLMQAGLKFRF